MQKQQWIAGGKVYKTKKAITEELRRILRSHPMEEDISGEDGDFLMAVIAWHPDAADKIGCGIKRFFVRMNEAYRTPSFWLERRDGTQTDWSFYHCLTPKHPLHDLLDALRHAIEPQIIQFKRSAFNSPIQPVCPFLGTPLDWHDCHVDHAMPLTFDVLVKDFLAETGIDPATVVMEGWEDGCVTKRLVDPDLRSRWQDYHREHALLRLTSKLANLSHAKKTLIQG